MQEACEAHGPIVRAIGDRIAFTPPLIMMEADVVAMCTLLGQALDTVWNGLRSDRALAAD